MTKSKNSPIDVDLIDLERMKQSTSEKPGLESYPIEKGGVSFAPTKQGAIKSSAFSVMDEQIDMQMSNEKLVQRAINMVIEETNATFEVAKNAIETHQSVRKAIDAINS